MVTVESKSRIPEILGDLEFLARHIFQGPKRGHVRGKRGRMVTLFKRLKQLQIFYS